jgi:nicotinic acid mononucleotide adenylyltransferase
MRIEELVIKPIKPKPPMTPAQSRVHALKKNVERSKQQLNTERERQRQQRETERLRKAQQRLSLF